MPRKPRIFLALGAMVFIAACVTVNIYFPAAEVKKTAEKIVDDVYRDKVQPKKGGGESALETLFAWLSPAEAHAADATSVSNAAIRALKERIAANHARLVPYYNAGRVGIDKNGDVVTKNTNGMNVKELGTLRRIVSADKAARADLYRQVNQALKQPAGNEAKVRAIFAKTWRDKASKGWWIQDDSGTWRKK